MEINKIYTPITEDTRSTKIISQGEFNTGKNMNKNTDKLISLMTAMYEMPKTEITSLLDKYGTKSIAQMNLKEIFILLKTDL